MSLNLTGTIGNVLDTLRGLISHSAVELEFFEYSTVTGKLSRGTVQDKWIGYQKEDDSGSYQELVITDNAAVVAHANATLTIVSQPNVGDELTVGGEVYEFVSSGAIGNQINISADMPATAANIAAKVTADTISTLSTATSSLNAVSLIANDSGVIVINLESDGVRITKEVFAGGTPTLDSVLNDVTGVRHVTHAKIGALYYEIEGTPARPIETNDMIRYWLVRCAHTGLATLQ